MFFLIPGLGADERVFSRLRLPGPATVLRWLPPLSSAEPLPHYAARLAAAVPAHLPCWLVGVSFGGLLAQEIGRLRPLAQVVLVSSVAGPAELPRVLRLGRALGLHHLLPFGLLARLPRLAQWFSGARNGREFRLLATILRDTDPNFARWATAQLLAWGGPARPAVARIHGTHDRLLPAPAAGRAHLVPGAGHFLVFSHAAQVSRWLGALAAPAPAT